MSQSAGASDKAPYASVQQQDRDASPPPTLVAKRRTLKDKLGLYNIAVLSLGTVAILLAIAFLAFVWTVAINNTREGDLPQLWRLIVQARWVSRVVTLCSIVIRVAAAAQLCVFAAIVAALILERVGASTEDLPLLSMIRCANTGPNALIWNVIHTMGTGTQVGYSILIVVTVLNAIVMQFTSTLLLADLVPTRVVLGNVNRDVYFGMGELTDRDGVVSAGVNPYVGSDYWRTGSQTYPRFAEHRESPASQNSNFTDTGKVYRGFLPIQSADQRNVIRSYTGAMTVVDLRVLCVKPSLSNLTFHYAGDEIAAISGNIDVSQIHPDLSTTTEDGASDSTSNPFNCTAPSLGLQNLAATWNASLCILSSSPGKLLGGISPEDPDASSVGSTTASLLLNATRLDGTYGELATANSDTVLEQQQSSAAPWTKFGNEAMSFDLSICFTNPLPRDYDITANSASDASSYEANQVTTGTGALAGSFVYDTSGVQKMMGVDGADLTLEQRQLLTIVPPTNWNASRMDNRHNTKSHSFIQEVLNKDEDGDYSFQLVPWSIPKDAMHRNHVTLLQHVLSRSGNPALAMQALWTILLELAYYDLLPLNNIKAPANYGLSEEVLIPVRWNCFAAVMGILGLHILLVFTALVLFVTRTEMSLLGNAWQAVSQVLSTDTADAIHHGAMATDDEVKDTFKNSGISDGRIRIAKCEQSGRTEARTVVRRR